MKKQYILLTLFCSALLSTTYLSSSLNLTREERWIVNAANDPAAYCTSSKIPNSLAYKAQGKQGTLQEQKEGRVLLYNLCGETLSNNDPDLYQKLFKDLKFTDKITPVQSAILSAVRDPATGCPIAGFFGSSLESLNKTNKDLLCYACYYLPPDAEVSSLAAGIGNLLTSIGLKEANWHQSHFLMQGDWKALQATCPTKAKTAITQFCTALNKIPTDDRTPHVQKLLTKCVSEGHIKQSASASGRASGKPSSGAAQSFSQGAASLRERQQREAQEDPMGQFYNQ